MNADTHVGKSGLEVSALGFGCMGISQSYGRPSSREDGIAIVRAAVDRGVTFFDTAEVYGPYTNEDVVGETLEPSVTSWPSPRNSGSTSSTARWPVSTAVRRRSARCADASLKRLRTDRIDLLYQHRVDPEVPIEDVAGAVKDLIGEGKVKHFGMSCQ
jgi:aryl-alcohol dehydrogenase-like predicted oxidoreductase